MVMVGRHVAAAAMARGGDNDGADSWRQHLSPCSVTSCSDSASSSSFNS
ncbi:hypothetical protein A2U01_0107698, partial [Trifolium medium]|nr:hypothetical protein [Trifolium medium]